MDRIEKPSESNQEDEMKGNQEEQTNEGKENNQDVEKNSELGNNRGVIRRDDEMEMEPPEVLRIWGRCIHTFHKSPRYYETNKHS